MIEYKSVVGEKPEVKYIEKDGILYETPEYSDYKNKLGLEYKLKRSGIPIFIINYDFEKDYIGDKDSEVCKKVLRYCDKFSEKFFDKTIYFYGDRGTQKTTVAYWIGKKLIRQGKDVKFVTMKKLVDDLSNLQFNPELNEKIEGYKKADLLIVDRAFDKDQVTVYKSGYQLSFLDSFLRERIENSMRATIIISNNAVEEISDNKFNSDLEDLVKRSTVSIGTAIEFKDHYSLKDDFEIKDLWG